MTARLAREGVCGSLHCQDRDMKGKCNGTFVPYESNKVYGTPRPELGNPGASRSISYKSGHGTTKCKESDRLWVCATQCNHASPSPLGKAAVGLQWHQE